MKITWLGHAAFRVETSQATILIDPFISQSPTGSKLDFAEVTKGVTHIALTHGHGDHIGDTIRIASETGATVIANADLTDWLAHRGVAKVDPTNTGGTVFHEGFSVTFVNALHSSASLTEDGISHSLGNANGLVFHFDDEDAPALYHMGDTDIFSDMALINELHQPEIALVPVGDRFTMGGTVAALACQRYFPNLKTAIPCHFGTFGLLEQTADAFVLGMEKSKTEVQVLEVGDSLTV
ncbi:metal-dependent hydrolase [Pseudochrobactrum sp. sp1633]|uniref:metal-dependent hydrolase n=1 Tax=Pseudochrobactrum sp. sp1633 TaxID=3036706 RepID=UPI0025A5F7F4|nr:metal-dependent hydrolase [Pseudochrobactrum sp. sp1633]MDM8344823.1 metal-dependent hydrolase [Pseudochrobactrum sp. sp1633]HWD13416.1 metal-dependent hydrolase [Pseudochrobactrum sp.]